MPRTHYTEDTEWFRSFNVSPDKSTSFGPYGPYSKPGTAKGVATRHGRWSHGCTPAIQQLKAFIGDDGKPYLAWENADGQLSFDDAL